MNFNYIFIYINIKNQTKFNTACSCPKNINQIIHYRNSVTLAEA